MQSTQYFCRNFTKCGASRQIFVKSSKFKYKLTKIRSVGHALTHVDKAKVIRTSLDCCERT